VSGVNPVTLTDIPVATALVAGLIDMVAAGAGNEPERLSYHASWQIWQPLGGGTPQPPSVVRINGGEDVFVTGTNSGLYLGAVSTARTPQPPVVPRANQAPDTSAARRL
jgi:hypothetical protein